MLTEERSLKLLTCKFKVSDIQAKIMENKFEGENLLHLVSKKKKKDLFGATLFLTTSYLCENTEMVFKILK